MTSRFTFHVSRVVLFVIDGLRPDGLREAPTPSIDRLIAEGAVAWQAQSVTPSVSLPCHASLFLAVPPARHGILTNAWVPPQPPVPGLIEAVRAAGRGGSAAFYTWEPLRDLWRPGALDFAYFHDLHDALEGAHGGRDMEIGSVAAQAIVEQQPALAFVYLGDADEVAHRYGWMSEPYLHAVERADRAIGLVLERLEASGALADTVFLVLADHGGHGFDHSEGTAEDVTIPWVVSGPGVRRGHQIAGPVSIVDTAPTIAHLLGLPIPAEWSGRIVTEALRVNEEEVDEE